MPVRRTSEKQHRRTQIRRDIRGLLPGESENQAMIRIRRSWHVVSPEERQAMDMLRRARGMSWVQFDRWIANLEIEARAPASPAQTHLHPVSAKAEDVTYGSHVGGNFATGFPLPPEIANRPIPPLTAAEIHESQKLCSRMERRMAAGLPATNGEIRQEILGVKKVEFRRNGHSD